MYPIIALILPDLRLLRRYFGVDDLFPFDSWGRFGLFSTHWNQPELKHRLFAKAAVDGTDAPGVDAVRDQLVLYALEPN